MRSLACNCQGRTVPRRLASTVCTNGLVPRVQGRAVQRRHRSVSASAAGHLSPAEVARTITSLVTYGTLSTITSDGLPLGTFVTFVLDDGGRPLLRLRADAMHTANLTANSRCTLFAHAAEAPARELARVTLIGSVEDLSHDEASLAAARHAQIYGSAVGVDAPQQDDVFMRLNIEKCFYVAGLGEPRAETLTYEEYAAAAPDDLKDDATRLVAMYNRERAEDVLRLTAGEMGVPFEQMHEAEFVWIDTRGVHLRGQTLDGVRQTARLEFIRQALDELDALSLITMAAQQAWEAERSYTPTMPELATKSEA